MGTFFISEITQDYKSMLTHVGLYLIAGFTLGLTAGIAPGPLSALLVAQTLRHGVGEGVKIACAPVITDLPIIGVALLLMSCLPEDPWPLGLISLMGGCYLGYLAWCGMTLQPPQTETGQNPGDALKKGALVNLLNPHPYLFWLTVGAPLLIKLWPTQPWASAGWLTSFYIALVGSKIILAVIVGQTRRWLNGNIYIWFNRFLGILLAVFALMFALDGLRLLGFVQ